jgi:hypothetical protein
MNTRSKWLQLSPDERERRLVRMRAYQKQRYEQRKALGIIKLKGRQKGCKGEWKVNQNRQFIIEQKIEAGECCECGLPCEEWNHVMFAWDHVDRSTKLFSLSQAKARPLKEIADEIKKCVLMCHNCHAFKTYINRDHDSTTERVDTIQLPTLFD